MTTRRQIVKYHLQGTPEKVFWSVVRKYHNMHASLLIRLLETVFLSYIWLFAENNKANSMLRNQWERCFVRSYNIHIRRTTVSRALSLEYIHQTFSGFDNSVFIFRVQILHCLCFVISRPFEFLSTTWLHVLIFMIANTINNSEMDGKVVRVIKNLPPERQTDLYNL